MEPGSLIHLDVALDKKAVIKWFYDMEDYYFFRHIHKSQGTKDQCIEDTCLAIGDGSEMILVYAKDELAAFFVRARAGDEFVLEGFHVAKEYRTRNFLTIFWVKVRTYFDKEFKVGIYCKNEPALRCLLQEGFTIEGSKIVDKKLFIILKS